MRRNTVLIALLAVSCGSTPAKEPNADPGSNNALNVGINNAVTNSATNSATNNGTNLEECGPDSAAPARILGLSGIEVAGEATGVVTAVAPDELSLLVSDVQGAFYFEGGDLSELFDVDDEVVITVSEIEGDQFDVPHSRVQSVAGPRGVGAEIGWSSFGGFGDFVAPSVDLPLAAATATFGEALGATTYCGEQTDCGIDMRGRTSFALDVTYRGAVHPIKPGEDYVDDEYSFHWANAKRETHSGASNDDCIAEGGAAGSLRVTAWGRVFL